VRLVVKPTSTISIDQDSVNMATLEPAQFAATNAARRADLRARGARGRGHDRHHAAGPPDGVEGL